MLAAGEYEVQLRGVRIHYSVTGSGPVLLAHSGGPGMDARTWGDFAGLGDSLTIVAIHPRGSGLSGMAPDGAYLLGDYADDLEALQRHLAIERPAVMGWSHGGMVAQQFAATYPESLSKLILYDTAAYFGEFLGDVEAAVEAYRDQPWFERSLAALKAEWAGEYSTDEEMTRLWADEAKFYFRRFDSDAQAFHERTKDYPIHVEPLSTFNEREATSMDLRPLLRRISVPTLVIVGRHDFITTVSMAEEIVRNLPRSRLEVFEDSGHFALVEERRKFYETVKGFVLEGVV